MRDNQATSVNAYGWIAEHHDACVLFVNGGPPVAVDRALLPWLGQRRWRWDAKYSHPRTDLWIPSLAAGRVVTLPKLVVALAMSIEEFDVVADPHALWVICQAIPKPEVEIPGVYVLGMIRWGLPNKDRTISSSVHKVLDRIGAVLMESNQETVVVVPRKKRSSAERIETITVSDEPDPADLRPEDLWAEPGAEREQSVSETEREQSVDEQSEQPANELPISGTSGGGAASGPLASEPGHGPGSAWEILRAIDQAREPGAPGAGEPGADGPGAGEKK